jgi:signal-transduction protein with cAMP-binding, CBS, and nucleotidyltransferase domain
MMTYAESIAGAFSKDDCELPHGIIEISEYEKNSDVLKIGHYCKHLYFLVDGAVLVYSVAKEKLRITHMFLSRSFFY